MFETVGTINAILQLHSLHEGLKSNNSDMHLHSDSLLEPTDK